MISDFPVTIKEYYDSYINGEWIESEETFDVSDPATNELLATVSEAGPDGVDSAISSAKSAYEEWGNIDPSERGRILHDVASAIRENSDHLARLETMEVGRPLRESKALIAAAAGHYDYYSGMADKIESEMIPVPGNRLNYTVREPLGVVGQIIPWNGPMIIGARGLAPALACGNTIVGKPSPEAPLTLLEFAEIATEAGLPDGVLNMVPGDGKTTGAALTSDPRVDGLLFTGSRETGTVVMQAAAENIVPVSLELGGKNPSIVFDDADIEQVIDDTMKVYYNATQVCFAPTRLFLHEDVYDDILDTLVSRIESMQVGPGIDNPDMGPLISVEAQQRVTEYVEQARGEGARVLAGGEIPRNEGNFYAPTIIENIADDAPLSCDEIFGPVIAVYRFNDEKEVIRRANDTEYGLYAVLYTARLDRAHRVAGKIEAGSIAINEYPAVFPQAPFGGYKQSGIGRERGHQAIEHYTQIKNVTVSLGDSPGAHFDEGS